MKKLALLLAGLGLALASAGCRGRIPEGVFACATGADCPAGFVCGASSRCVLPSDGDVPDLDAGRVDAARLDGDVVDPDGGPECIAATDDLDILLVVDNSNSMAEEQNSLIAALPRFIRRLTTEAPSGTLPFRSVHVGVVTTDMGAPGAPTCSVDPLGDDGILRTSPSGAPTAGCEPTYPAVFDFDPVRDFPNEFANSVACVARTGTGGCGFEQPLDAALKALSPRTATTFTADGYVAPRFAMGTSGHGADANRGLVRDSSVLAILLVTDEEDCSTQDPDLFNPSSATYSGDLNLRCFMHPEVLHTVDRFRLGFGQLRTSPSRLVFGAITGIPIAAEGMTYAQMLAHPMMREEIDPSMSTRLRPSCDVMGRGLAFPPRRIVGVAAALEEGGAHTSIQSICQASYDDATDAFIAEIGEARAAICP